jgi:hypothetical protein
MIFVILTFLAAIFIESLGTWVSVIGLSALFGSNPIIIALVIALDLGKLVSVSLLYTHWGDLPKLMKGYALIASAVLMIITSTGAAGYLSSEFQRGIVGTQEGSLKVDVLKKQQAKYEDRKKQIDDLVAKVPDKYSANQRIRVMNQFKQEQAELQVKINQIDKDLPALQVKQIGTEAHAGPILYIAKAFEVPVEVAVKYVILLIIFVFDPLAIFLIIAGNFLLSKRRVGQAYGPPGELVLAENQGPFNDDLINMPPTGSEDDDIRTMPAKYARSDWPADIDEPGFGNSAVRFDEQMKAMPVKLRNGFTPPEPMPPAPVPPPEKTEKELDDEFWLRQEEIARERKVLNAARIAREDAEDLAATESSEVLPETAPIVDDGLGPMDVVTPMPPFAPVEDRAPTRETITLSSLGLAPVEPVHHVTSFGGIEADPHTVVDASQIDQVTPFQATPYSRPTKKLPAR